MCMYALCNNSTIVLVTILLEDNGAGLLECVRVYGNLSQDVEVRRLIVEKKSKLMYPSTLSIHIILTIVMFKHLKKLFEYIDCRQ